MLSISVSDKGIAKASTEDFTSMLQILPSKKALHIPKLQVFQPLKMCFSLIATIDQVSTVSGTLLRLFHSIFITTLQGRYYPHFAADKIS